MKQRRTVFVGSVPPADRAFDWVVEPAARVSLGDTVAVPDVSIIKALLDEAVPIIDDLTGEANASLLRDEFFQLVLSVARVEALLRSLDAAEPHTVVATHRLPRPSRPGNLGEGLARFLEADLQWTGARQPQRFPARAVGSSRAWRWSRGRPPKNGAPIVAAIGGPSELRALQPVCDYLPDEAVRLLDFSLQPIDGIRTFGSYLKRRDAFSDTEHRKFLARSVSVWGRHEWWGARWLPWVKPSLQAMAGITLREGVLFREAGRRALADVELLVTAKVRFARARAIIAAAQELAVPTVATQHGMYVDGNEWTDIRADAFATSGAAFAAILRRRGYSGEIIPAGAPFYTVPEQVWDCGIALQPPEGVVITSRGDYERHVLWAYRSARSVLGDDAIIGFRVHPREDEDTLRQIIGDDVPTSRDPGHGARLWITVESSFVVEAVLSGAPAVLINFNGHPWEYRFATMPGSRVAMSEDELRATLADMVGGESEVPVEVWREEFAVATGTDASQRIASIITDRRGR
jgi:hypothetical protein